MIDTLDDSATVITRELALAPADNERLASLCGPLDQHLKEIEKRLNVTLSNRGNQFRLKGTPEAVEMASHVLENLYHSPQPGPLAAEHVHLALQSAQTAQRQAARADTDKANGSSDGNRPNEPDAIETANDSDIDLQIRTRRGLIRGRGVNQQRYLRAILTHDICFGVGPAGTGKTYLAVACAVDALERDLVRRLVLVRPAVEAGERLGFLPGDLVQKVDPYLRPLYDALYEMLGFEKVHKLIERNVIEIAPLAFMRGRTLNESFIILDEAQNTTAEQMKMFLTRLGFGSTAVITGDVTQVDLPRNTQSGLKQALSVLADVEGISRIFFDAEDVVRHPMVQRIVSAYGRYEQITESER